MYQENMLNMSVAMYLSSLRFIQNSNKQTLNNMHQTCKIIQLSTKLQTPPVSSLYST